MQFEDFQNEAQFRNYCLLHADEIMIRAQIAGKFETVPITALPSAEQDLWITDWWQRGQAREEAEKKAGKA